MDVSSGTKLNKQLTCSYKSFAGFSHSDGSSPSEFTCDFSKNHDFRNVPKEIPLKEMASGNPDLFGHSPSNLSKTDEHSSSQDGLVPLYALCITFTIGVTVALILHFCLGESLVFVKGVLVSDHELCTGLGQKVLHDRGSSVDAAIVAVLCLGIVHPHVSGIGGGGVMLVHDIHKNETQVINFQGTLPKALTEEKLQNVLNLKAGLQVGVPGMLRGLYHAHRLYGSLSWEDVVIRAAVVAKEGFNVSFSLAEAISEVKGEELPQCFKAMFFPGGQALRAGLFLRMPSLAEVLEAGVSNFYEGNLSQEIVNEVQTNGGVLSREDIYNYRVDAEQPVENLYNDLIIQVPHPPSAGAALITALTLLESFNFNQSNITEKIAEALNGAGTMASGLFDPEYNSSMTELISDMLSKNHPEVPHQRIDYTHKAPPKHHSIIDSLRSELPAGQVVVMGPDDVIVSVASSLSRSFGSRLITRSGVILNSLILDFSRPNTTTGQFQTNKTNGVHSRKRPLSFLMPTLVLPSWNKCGMYMALSSSGGLNSLNAVIQVLISVLYNHKEKNSSLSLHLPHRFLVDAASPGLAVRTNPVIWGILRNKDVTKVIAVPQLSDVSSE